MPTNEDDKNVNQMNTAYASLGSFLACISSFFVIIGLIGTIITAYTNYQRYKLIGTALHQGNSGTAAMLASPEMARGLGFMASGVKRMI